MLTTATALTAGCSSGPASTFEAGEVFQDCADCPVMVVVPPGTVTMGVASDDSTVQGSDQPQVTVSIPRAFAVGQHEVTVAQFRTFAENTAWQNGHYPCDAFEGDGVWAGEPLDHVQWNDAGFEQTDDHPVVCVSWNTAHAYAAWLSFTTGHRYRLLTEAEHEYANRAGRTGYWVWGVNEGRACDMANVGDSAVVARFPAYQWPIVSCDDGHANTAPVMSFEPNPFGLYDMTGNVSEWIQDCYFNSHRHTPPDGRAAEFTNCPFRRIKGGSWFMPRLSARIAARLSYRPHGRITETGIRVARDLD